MVDIVSPEVRSRMMSGIRGKDTKPEMTIRKGLHCRGFRYRLHARELPGKPDLVFAKYHAVIFVHGCFWHRHKCHLFKWPKTRPDFWRTKIDRNCEVDKQVTNQLIADGWRVLTIWECALKGIQRLPVEDVLTTTADWLRSENIRESITGTNANNSRSEPRNV